MAGPTRRGLLAGAAGLALAPHARAAEALTDELRKAPSDSLLSKLSERIAAGLTPRELHEAFTLASCLGVGADRGLSRTFDLVIAVDAVARADARCPSELRWWPWIWLTHFWGEERGGGKPLPSVKAPRMRDPAGALETALSNWDGDHAAMVVKGWALSGDPSAAFDHLALAAARDARYVGRKVEHLAGTWRNLETVGMWHAETVLQSVVRALCVREEPAGTRYQGGFDEAHAAAKRPAGKLLNSDGPQARIRRNLEMLTTATPMEAQAAFIREHQEGLPAGAAWTALRLGAARLTRDKPTHVVGRRAVSTIEGLHDLSSKATDAVTRTTLLFRGAWRLAFFRDQASSDGSTVSLGPPPAPLPSPRPDKALQVIVRGARDPKDYICGLAALDMAADLPSPWGAEALAAVATSFPATPSKALPKRAAKVLGD